MFGLYFSVIVKTLLKRARLPGDFVFAVAFVLFSVWLLSQIGSQTEYVSGKKLITQPRFWPAVSLIGMVIFAGLFLLSSVVSTRNPGRWREVALWFSSLEYALWFVSYAWVVPFAGYLPSTLFFTIALTWRVGYRSVKILAWSAFASLVIVVLFKSFLQVKLPAGEIYDFLPNGLQRFMSLYL